MDTCAHIFDCSRLPMGHNNFANLPGLEMEMEMWMEMHMEVERDV